MLKEISLTSSSLCSPVISKIQYELSLEEISKFPSVLSCGNESVIFKYTENQVIVVTNEKDKYNFLYNLSLNSNFFVSKMKNLGIFQKFIELNFSVFIMTKGIPFDLSKIEESFYSEKTFEDPVITQVLSNFTFQNFQSMIICSEITDNLIQETIKTLFINIVKNINDLNKKGFLYNKNDYLKFSILILKSIKKSLNALKDSECSKHFIIDLHFEQFVLFNEEIVCVDPVYFDINNLI